MADTLARRGPDGQGIRLGPNRDWGLAHRRLAVIDIAGGKQPMSSRGEELWISYNGECYNYRQLRVELEAAGHRFRTNCDTEVVLHLYEQYGPQCVDRIRGMFALAVWDSRERQLFLARDRLGQKPLYYGVHKGRFIFASQCRAILQTEEFPRRVDTEAITRYLLLQYVPAPAGGFSDIRQLPPAHTLTIHADNYIEPVPHCYWSVPSEPSFTGTFNEAVEQVRSTLAEATRLRLMSDVSLGGFLSGGLDSTIIVGLMAEASGQKVKTCAIGFGERRYNELNYARQTAHRFGCDHYEYVVQPDCRAAVEQLICHYDEPFADCSALPTFYLSQKAREKVTVALSGDGGDECFGGYDRYRAMRLAERINRIGLLRWLGKRGFLHRMATPEHHSRRHRLRRFMEAAFLPAERRYLKWLAVFDPDMLTGLLKQPATSGTHWNYLSRYFAPAAQAEHTAGNTIEWQVAQAMLADAETYLPGDLNTKVDRASMAVGLEVRCPFQDHQVVELAYSLPSSWRHNGSVSKYILRRACGDLLPKAIARRAKMGFGVPVGQWFRRELRDMFVDTVLSQRSLQRGYFNRSAIETLLAENDRLRQDHGHRLWALLMLELWHRRYIDKS